MNKFLVFTTMLSCIMTNSFIVSDVNGASLYKNRLKEEGSDIVIACQRCLSNCDSALRLNIKSRIETLKAYGLDQEWIKKNYWAYAFSYDLQQPSEWKKSLSNLSNLMMMALTDVAPKETLIPDNYGQNKTVLKSTYVENDRSYRDDNHALNSTRKKICEAIVKTFRKISDPNKQDNNSEEGKKILGLLNGWLCLETLCSMSYYGKFSYDSSEALDELYNTSVSQITKVFCGKSPDPTQDNDWDNISQNLQKYILGQIRKLDESATLTNDTNFEKAFAKYMRHDWDCYLVQTGVICPIKFDHPEYGRISYFETVGHKTADGKVFRRIEKSTSAMKKCIDVMSDDQVDTNGSNALSMIDKYKIMKYDKSKNDMHESYRREFEKIRNSKTMVEGSNQKKNQDKVVGQTSTVINGDSPKTVESIKSEVKGENSKQTMPNSIQENSQSENSKNKGKSLIAKTMFQEKEDDESLAQPKTISKEQKQSAGRKEDNKQLKFKLKKVGTIQYQTQRISDDEIKEYFLTNWLYFKNPESGIYELNGDNFDLYEKAFVKTWYDKHAKKVKKCIEEDLKLLNDNKEIKDSEVWTVLSQWRTTGDDRTKKLFAAIRGLIESEMVAQKLNESMNKNLNINENDNVKKIEQQGNGDNQGCLYGYCTELSSAEINQIIVQESGGSSNKNISGSSKSGSLSNQREAQDDLSWRLMKHVVAKANNASYVLLSGSCRELYTKLGRKTGSLGRAVVDSVLFNRFFDSFLDQKLEGELSKRLGFGKVLPYCGELAGELLKESGKYIEYFLKRASNQVSHIVNLIILDYTDVDKQKNLASTEAVEKAVIESGIIVFDTADYELSYHCSNSELRNNPWYVKSVEALGLKKGN